MKEIMAAFRLREKATRYQEGERQGLLVQKLFLFPMLPLLATLERLFI